MVTSIKTLLVTILFRPQVFTDSAGQQKLLT